MKMAEFYVAHTGRLAPLINVEAAITNSEYPAIFAKHLVTGPATAYQRSRHARQLRQSSRTG